MKKILLFLSFQMTLTIFGQNPELLCDSVHFDNVQLETRYTLNMVGFEVYEEINSKKNGWGHFYYKGKVNTSRLYQNDSLIAEIAYLRGANRIETFYKNGLKHGREMYISKRQRVIWENFYYEGILYMIRKYNRRGKLKYVIRYEEDKVTEYQYDRKGRMIRLESRSYD